MQGINQICDQFVKSKNDSIHKFWSKNHNFSYEQQSAIATISGTVLGGTVGGMVGKAGGGVAGGFLCGPGGVVPGAYIGEVVGGGIGAYVCSKGFQHALDSYIDNQPIIKQFSANYWDTHHPVAAEQIQKEVKIAIHGRALSGNETLYEGLLKEIMPIWNLKPREDKGLLKVSFNEIKQEFLRSAMNINEELSLEPVAWCNDTHHEIFYDKSDIINRPVAGQIGMVNCWKNIDVIFPAEELRVNHGLLAVKSYVEMFFMDKLLKDQKISRDLVKGTLIGAAFTKSAQEFDDFRENEIGYRDEKLNTFLVDASKERRSVEKAAIRALEQLPVLHRFH
jgi:hypothetical protein